MFCGKSTPPDLRRARPAGRRIVTDAPIDQKVQGGRATNLTSALTTTIVNQSYLIEAENHLLFSCLTFYPPTTHDGVGRQGFGSFVFAANP